MSCGIGSLGGGESEQAQEHPSGETDQEAIVVLEKLGAKVVVVNFFDIQITDAGVTDQSEGSPNAERQ